MLKWSSEMTTTLTMAMAMKMKLEMKMHIWILPPASRDASRGE